MSNEMIERVGYAIAVANARNASIQEVAKAAITAMREPSEGMKEVGLLDPGSGGPDAGYETEVWQAMIDAALKE